MRNVFVCLLLLTSISLSANTDNEDWKAFSDSLSADLKERTSVDLKIKLLKSLRRQGHRDFYFSRELSDLPLRKDDIVWLRKRISSEYPDIKMGRIFSGGRNIEDYVGHVSVKDPRPEFPFIEQEGLKMPEKGLAGRTIALWQSHGRYFNADEGRWKWQRAPLHGTIEDIYTQSYVLPFLIPMLENAGAYVITPRERDTNSFEVIADNDSSFWEGRGLPGVRRRGRCVETGLWTDCGSGFADTVATLKGDINPFAAGTARKAVCVNFENPSAEMIWELSFPEPGRYAVYISYKSLPESSDCAHYCVRHAGGKSSFIVNQCIGGGTWIYLGSFDFTNVGIVTLDNSTPKGRLYKAGSVVTADAVRAGGGMGKIEREGMLSGLPSYLEGAAYNLQWSGFSKGIWGSEDSDYVNDYSCRPYWVKELKDKYGLRADLSLAFHTDAGTAACDSTVGTLAIYSLSSEGSSKLSDGTHRTTCRDLAMTVQDEVVGDIRRNWNQDWNRRGTCNRSYRESRACDVPAMILELLSHQNFADMKYGLDPQFRFDVSRSVYKGILKYLSSLYGCPFAVQPLPVRNFSTEWVDDSHVKLCWSPSTDAEESSAKPKGYCIQTRIDSGVFDQGKTVRECSAVIPVRKGHIYSFRIIAFNDGGKSFPSEILAVGRPVKESGEKVLIVNDFTRVGAPSWIDGEDLAGFDSNRDGGVAWGHELGYAGKVYEFHRDFEWIDDENPGFGACYTDYQPGKVAGNTFDFPYVHGKALLALGRTFCSSSAEAFDGAWDGIVDLICGKQSGTLPCRNGQVRHTVFSSGLDAALKELDRSGGRLIISGANIASDASYPNDRFGYNYVSGRAGRDGKVWFGDRCVQYNTSPGAEIYCVENADALRPSDKGGRVIARYNCERLPAAVVNEKGNVVALGFPIEALSDNKDIEYVLETALANFK